MKFGLIEYINYKFYNFFDNLDDRLLNFDACFALIRVIFATFFLTLLTTLSLMEMWCFFIPYYYLVLPKLVSIPLIFLANWVLLLFYFNIFMVIKTHAGIPDQSLFVFDGVNFCCMCKVPKPMRCHHCALCDICILKMDHHCPWFNKCIGFQNHRYFYVVMFIYTVGSAFLYVTGFPLFKNIYKEVSNTLRKTQKTYSFWELVVDLFLLEDFLFDKPNFYFDYFNFEDSWERSKFLIPMVINFPFFILQVTLMYFHTKLISNGETAVEYQINKSGRAFAKEKGLVYINYFDHGPKNNWIKFLGIDGGRSFFWNILVPCKYYPLEDGHTWERVERKPVFV